MSERGSWKRKASIGALVFVAIMGSAGIAVSLTATTLETEKISLFDGKTADSDFSIQAYETQVKGHDRVDIDLTIENTDSNTTHEANVTVQLLDSSGAVIAEGTKSTGSVSGDGTYSETWSFQGTDLATQYEETYIVIDQTA